MIRLQAALLLFALALPASAATTAAQVFEKASPSVFSVGVITANGEGRIGSAVMIGPNRVATNFHVVTGARKIYLKQGETSVEAWLELGDEKHDLAVLRAIGLNAPPAGLGPGGEVSVGQSVYAIGSPRGLELSLSEGIVSSRRSTEDGALIQTTAPISPGSSGGGLFDEHARLVGFTTAQVINGQNLNFAVPVEWLRYVGVKLNYTQVAAEAEPLPVTPGQPLSAPEVLPTAPPPAPKPPEEGLDANISAEPEAPAPVVTAQAAAPPEQTERSNLYVGLGLLAALLLLAKPLVNWLTDLLSKDIKASVDAPAVQRAVTDRLAPYRAAAREEIKNNAKDQDFWLMALEQTGGDESRAMAAYIESRAQTLYRTDLDRKWAAAQAESQGLQGRKG